MAEEQSSADVAEDYRLALEDLNSINRADISTLTTIARENTEHAHAITEALQKHIIKVGSPRIEAPIKWSQTPV
jgi:hypothetical protein